MKFEQWIATDEAFWFAERYGLKFERDGLMLHDFYNIIKELRLEEAEDLKEEALKEATESGYEEGYTVGYDEGYGYGHSDGYSEGYNEGYAEAKEET